MSVSTSHDRGLRLALGLWASLAFLVLWVGAAANLAGGGHLATDSWTWLTSLPDVVGFAVWVLLLPVAVGLWASQADPPAIVGGLVAFGLVLWTAVAWLGLARTLGAGRRA